MQQNSYSLHVLFSSPNTLLFFSLKKKKKLEQNSYCLHYIHLFFSLKTRKKIHTEINVSPATEKTNDMFYSWFLVPQNIINFATNLTSCNVTTFMCCCYVTTLLPFINFYSSLLFLQNTKKENTTKMACLFLLFSVAAMWLVCFHLLCYIHNYYAYKIPQNHLKIWLFLPYLLCCCSD